MKYRALLAGCLIIGCADPSTSPTPTGGRPTSAVDAGTGSTNDAAAQAWTFSTLRDLTLSAAGRDVHVELVRADRPDGGRSYLLYQHAASAGAPLVVQTEPYAGIDWTGEEVDARWAALGPGPHPDRDAPDFNGTDQTTYQAQTPQDAADGNNVWAVNGFGAIRAYGRFYAGGTLEDDALDAVAPYIFASTRATEIDLTRIGTLGGSWGGMMALVGASRAPAEARPRAVVAISPPSDFVEWWSWGSSLPSKASNPGDVTRFFSPYIRRLTPAIGAPPAGDRAAGFTHAGLCPTLPDDVLVPHDSWDTLIPIRETESFALACPKVAGLYWHRTPAVSLAPAALDHGPASSEGDLPSMFAFSYAHLVGQLAPASAAVRYSAASQSGLVVHLRLVLAEQKAGGDTRYILPRLRELADARLQLFAPGAAAPVPGAALVAAAVNQVWGTSFDEVGIRAQLTTGLPAPPPG